MKPIDAVVMWVDGEDEIARRQYANYSGTVRKAARSAEATARHRSSGELIYCLRGIAHHIPWIGRIHILTSGQIPPDLDFSDPRLNLVIHSDVFPDLSCLPTFNSFAIDACIHRIPGLTERFVRLSDDFLAISPVPKEALLGREGSGRYYFGHLVPDFVGAEAARTNYLKTLAFNRFVLGSAGITARHAPQHVPQMRELRVCEAIEKTFADDLARTRAARFRSDRDLSMLFFYPHVVAGRRELALDEAGNHVDPDFSYSNWSVARQALVGDARKDWRSIMRKAKAQKALFLNVNDHLGADPDPKDAADFRGLLEELLPEPAPWEIPRSAAPDAVAAGAQAQPVRRGTAP